MLRSSVFIPTDDGASDALGLEVVDGILNISRITSGQTPHQKQNLTTCVARHVLRKIGHKHSETKILLSAYHSASSNSSTGHRTKNTAHLQRGVGHFQGILKTGFPRSGFVLEFIQYGEMLPRISRKLANSLGTLVAHDDKPDLAENAKMISRK